jgi:hypothetical protein
MNTPYLNNLSLSLMFISFTMTLVDCLKSESTKPANARRTVFEGLAHESPLGTTQESTPNKSNKLPAFPKPLPMITETSDAARKIFLAPPAPDPLRPNFLLPRDSSAALNGPHFPADGQIRFQSSLPDEDRKTGSSQIVPYDHHGTNTAEFAATDPKFRAILAHQKATYHYQVKKKSSTSTPNKTKIFNCYPSCPFPQPGHDTGQFWQLLHPFGSSSPSLSFYSNTTQSTTAQLDGGGPGP